MRVKIQMTLPKLGIAWMFALVTINFNRVAIYDLKISALLITTMIGLYPFFGPLQPMFGKITDRFPIMGYRRSPYLLIGMFLGSIIFLPMPAVVEGISKGSLPALAAGFVLYFIFGISIALMANTYLDLVADVTTDETRSGVFAAAWTGQTGIIVVWAFVFSLVMPDFSLEAMQRLYNLTPIVVMIMAVLSVIGLERRLTPAEVEQVRKAPPRTITNNPITAAMALLSRNPAAQNFFFYILLVFPAIFLQDALQEVFGGEVLHLTVGQTTVFQQIFNGAVMIGMGMTAALGGRALGSNLTTPDLPLEQKKRIAAFGGFCVVICLALQALSAWIASQLLFNIALGVLGLSVGIFTMASITMMSDMTVEGQTGIYLGLWSLAQAVGLGLSFIIGGALHSLLIGSGLMSSVAGYTTIFGLEALFMLWCVLMVRGISLEALRRYAATAPRGVRASAV